MVVMETKTNVMRILDGRKLSYTMRHYTAESGLNGVEIAQAIGVNRDCAFKTLVAKGRSSRYFVFMIPVAKELDLKKAAQVTGEKSIEMIKAKELLPLTGYVHGGCSPIGMKKTFPTYIDQSAQSCCTICFSAGKVGYQVEMPLASLQKVVAVQVALLTE